MTRTLGPCSVPNGKRGPWTIDDVVVFRHDWYTQARNPELYCPPGTYRRLSHERYGVVMSNTRMEINTNLDAWMAAKGRVLINGLGLGMLLEAVLQKPEVDYVRVVEVDADVISLVACTFIEALEAGRLEIVHADAREYLPAVGEKFDYAWHDIWNDADVANFPDMNKLVNRYKRFAKKQGCWSREMVRRDLRRNGMTVKEALE